MSEGWVKLHRQMADCAELQDPFAVALWVRLLLKAASRKRSVPFRNKFIALEPGQVVTSVRLLVNETAVPMQRVRTILARFAKCGMIEINTLPNTDGSLITLCNFAAYQVRDLSTNTAANTASTQDQHTEQEGKKDRRESESESLTESHGLPSPSARAARAKSVYPDAFERVWLTYPRRDEDDKAGCHKLWRAAVKDHDAAAIQASAEEWHREQRDNEFRIGLRRWLKDRRYLTPAPIHRPNGSPKADPFFAAAHNLMNPRDATHEQDDFGPVLEGTRDSEPHEAAGGGEIADPFGGGGPAVVGGIRRRVDALPAPGRHGWVPPVGQAEGDLAEPRGTDRFH